MKLLNPMIEQLNLVAFFVFLLLCLVKMLLLFANRHELLVHFSGAVAKAEKFVVWILLASSIYLFTYPNGISPRSVSQLTCLVVAIPLSIVAFRMQFRVMSVVALALLLMALLTAGNQFPGKDMGQTVPTHDNESILSAPYFPVTK